jgi:hypothetical protein
MDVVVDFMIGRAKESIYRRIVSGIPLNRFEW